MIALFALPVAAGQDEQELTALLEEFLDGASRNDAQIHDRFWAEDLIYTSSAGERFGKEHIMSGMNDEPDADGDSISIRYSAEDIQIQLYGKTAIVAFRLMGIPQGEAAGELRFYNTGTFLKRNDQWRAVAWQATKIPVQE